MKVGEGMGSKQRVDCEECGTSYDRLFLLGKQGDLSVCPMCGSSIAINDDGVSSYYNEPSFGDDVELSENDSFDEDKIDCWWYSIREPGEIWEGITYTDGKVSANCAKCGHFIGTMPYPVARTGDYLLISSKFHDKCSHCGNEMKNHIISKRPSDWVDPRKREMWATDYAHMPKCPICSSTKIHKISMTNKAASAFTFGIFAAGHVSKTYKCDTCGAKF